MLNGGLIVLADELPYPASIGLGQCKQTPIRDVVIPAGGEIEEGMTYLSGDATNLLTQEDTKSIERGQTKLFVYGMVHYRDIHRGRYQTLFGSGVSAIQLWASMGFFPSSEEYNRHNAYGPD